MEKAYYLDYINELVYIICVVDPYLNYRTCKMIDKVIDECYEKTGHRISLIDNPEGIYIDGELIYKYDFEW